MVEAARRPDDERRRQHLARTGFVVRRITYTNVTLLPLVAGVRFAQRLVGHRESDSEMRVPAAPVNLALSGVLAIEGVALRFVDIPLGSSLLALARRP